MRSGLLALGVVVALVAACGLGPQDTKPDRDATRVGAADRLGDGDEATALADLLAPDERAAAERAGIPVAPPSPDPADADTGAAANEDPPASKAAVVGIAFLQVGLSFAAMAAPFFAF